MIPFSTCDYSFTQDEKANKIIYNHINGTILATLKKIIWSCTDDNYLTIKTATKNSNEEYLLSFMPPNIDIEQAIKIFNQTKEKLEDDKECEMNLFNEYLIAVLIESSIDSYTNGKSRLRAKDKNYVLKILKEIYPTEEELEKELEIDSGKYEDIGNITITEVLELIEVVENYPEVCFVDDDYLMLDEMPLEKIIELDKIMGIII